MATTITPIQLSTFWPYQISVLADQVSRYTVKVAKNEAGLNLSQWRVLAAIAEQPGRTSASVVAITPMDKGLVSRAVSALIELGLVEKTIDNTDKRCFFLKMTPAGAEKYTKVATHLNHSLPEAFKDFPQQEFVRALSYYIEKMEHLSPADE